MFKTGDIRYACLDFHVVSISRIETSAAATAAATAAAAYGTAAMHAGRIASMQCRQQQRMAHLVWKKQIS